MWSFTENSSVAGDLSVSIPRQGLRSTERAQEESCVRDSSTLEVIMWSAMLIQDKLMRLNAQQCASRPMLHAERQEFVDNMLHSMYFFVHSPLVQPGE
jgi:hypothetical protein